MQLKSTDFNNNNQIPVIFTCKGANKRPHLQVDNVPHAAKSLAIIVHDPDSPSGNFIHWVAWNLPVALSGGQEGVNDFGLVGYGGPCPHKGKHRYIFTLYALDTSLSLPQKTTGPELLAKMQGHIVETATLTGTFAADEA